MWHRLDFLIPPEAEGRLFGDKPRSQRGFRKLLAAASTKYGIGLPPHFFGYGPDGRPDPKAEISISMGWAPRGLFLLGIGQESSRLLLDRSGAINAALMHEAQALIPMSSRSGEHDANFLPFERRFYIHNLGLGKVSADTFWMRAAKAVQEGSTWLREADRKLSQAVSRGLLHQALYLIDQGDDLEGSMAALLSYARSGERTLSQVLLEWQAALDVRIAAVASHTYDRLDEHRTRLILKGVELTMRADLTGPWLVGRMKIEGEGLIRPSTRAWASDQKEVATA